MNMISEWDAGKGEMVDRPATDEENAELEARRAAAGQEAFDNLVREYDTLVQGRLDQKARDFLYDSMSTAVTYASEPAVVKFQAEGQLLRAWRSRYWAACWPILEAVRQGQRPIPAPDALIEELDQVAPPPTVAEVNAKIAELTA